MLKRFAISVAVLTASGCAVIDNSFSPRVSTLNFGIDRATNDAILTNIVRASRLQPLTFVAISKISGSQTASLSNGLPTFAFGPDLTSAQKQFTFANNSINQNASGNFDVAPLGGRDFTRGLLLPLTLQEIELLLRQGLPRELVFNLVVEGFEFNWCDKAPKTGSPKCDDHHMANQNDLEDIEGWASIPKLIKGLVTDGLNVEIRQESNPDFQRGDKADQVSRKVIGSRFCFNYSDAAPQKFKFGPEWRCGTGWYDFKPGTRTPSSQKAILFNNKPIDITIHVPEFPDGIRVANVRVLPRSLYGIFRYLGHMFATQKILNFPVRDISTTRYPLLQIEIHHATSCFAAVQFEEQSFCVPEDGSPATKVLFSILAQLIALKTQPGDLPFTPTVRIAP